MAYFADAFAKKDTIPQVGDPKLGEDLHAGYVAAHPFPHIIIDDFLPQDIADACLSGFPKTSDPESQFFDRDQERLKTSYNPDYLDDEIQKIFQKLNARPFLKFLENLTGIKGLITDPYYLGGGFHEIKNGGHLSVHADFNYHHIMKVERRINVLIYLNPEWKEEYGGQLELWSDDMAECVHSVVPLHNRCVIFNTTSNSNHGNPQVVNNPLNISRKSIALYYYTATWSDVKKGHTTQFRPRVGTGDKIDFSVRVEETIKNLLPPILHRTALRVWHKISKFILPKP